MPPALHVDQEEELENLPNPGVITTPELEAELGKVYKFAEIVSAVEPVNWEEKSLSAIRKFPIFSQNGSGSCVAQTLRKQLGIYIYINTGTWVDLSASHIYQRRANRPAAGMGGEDVFIIGQKGTTLEVFAPSENMTDAQMDAIVVKPFMSKIGETFKLGAYMTVAPFDIDTIASIIQKTGKGIMTWFYFKNTEWTNFPSIKFPNLDRYAETTARHSVTAVDFTLIGKNNFPQNSELWGKKALVIDDSWGLAHAMNGQRVITEDFLKTRCFFVAHFQNFAFEEGGLVKPRYIGTTKSLQDCLKFEGLFPVNTESSGIYGPITTKAVKEFQKKYGIDQVGVVGPLTTAKLKALYP